MAKRMSAVVIVLLLGWTTGLWAADPGDAVLFKGTPGVPEIDESIIKMGGVLVQTVGASASEYSPARLATTGDITLAGEQTIDGVLTSTSAVVVWLQTTATQNGIYLSSSGAWTRRTDADLGSEFAGNKALVVQAGTRFANTVFRVQNITTVTVGSTAIVIAPESPQWHVAALQTIAPGGSVTCASPSAGQVIGTIVPVVGDGEPVSLGSPFIVAGTRTNQLCLIEGTDDVNTVDIGDGSGVQLIQDETPVTFAARTSMLLRWTGTIWRQLDQTGLQAMGGAAISLQQACNNGLNCGWDLLTELRPLRIAPAGDTGPKELIYESGGDFIRQRLNGDNSPAAPEVLRLYPDQILLIQALLGTPTPSWQDVGFILNDAGLAIVKEGVFAEAQNHLDTTVGAHEASAISFDPTGAAQTTVQLALDKTTLWHLPWSASGSDVDGTACVLGAAAAINSGPRIRAVTCTDSASGTIEFSFDTPARYDGGAMTICFEVNDPVDADNVWEVSVQAQYRGSAAVVNNTWTTAAADASVTLATANANYYACTSVTPNAAAAGTGRVFIKATVDAAGGYNDGGNARLLGGYVTGR